MSGRLTPSGLATLTELHASTAAAERRAALLGRPFAVVMVALAGLPLVNARDGYAAGDALIELACAAAADVARRHAATPGRHGAARLALVLPDAGADEARALAGALCEALPPAAGAELAIAVRRPAESGDQVLQRARDALRHADPAPAVPVSLLRVVAEGEPQPH
jgi:GGDEF domain-containing protein